MIATASRSLKEMLLKRRCLLQQKKKSLPSSINTTRTFSAVVTKGCNSLLGLTPIFA